jgi:putative acetyltransferase
MATIWKDDVMSIEIEVENPISSDVVELIRVSDKFYADLYPHESNHLLDIDSLRRNYVKFHTARDDGRLLGIGALVLFGTYGEIKRMYVDDLSRRRGVGDAILRRIEFEAMNCGCDALMLETGVRQTAAINLYKRHGFNEIPAFGNYKSDPLSLFLKKNLARAASVNTPNR